MLKAAVVVAVVLAGVLVDLSWVFLFLLGYDEEIAGVDDAVREDKDME